MMRRHGAAFRAALMSADLASAVLLFVLVAGVRFGGREWEAALGQAIGYTWLAAATYAAGWVLILWLRGLYQLRTRWSARREALDVASAAAVLAVVTFALLFLLHLGDVSRLFLLALFPAQALLTFVSRFALRRTFEWVRAHGGNARFVLVVGTGEAAQAFADRIEAHRALGLRVVGHLTEVPERRGPVTRPILGGLEEVVEVLHRTVVDEVAICLPAADWALVEPITRVCEAEGRVVRVPMEVVGLPMERGIVEDFDGQPVVSYVYGPDRALGLLLKRTIDVGLSALALALFSPVLLAVAAMIRLVDGPGVVFRQTRVGLHGRTFTLLKFRTMVPDAEVLRAHLGHLNEVKGGAFKLTDDPRLTRTGRWLRRTSLDELPQLWNVVRGEMSLVGPRPPLPDEVETYDLWHRRRLSMKPGITGLWQVEGRRDPVFDRWVRLDLDYIDRWSLLLDLRIMLRTIPAMLSQEGR
jgi:exopolysaccharide biosynthesis polyprenyl glycosylphosphotransferase